MPDPTPPQRQSLTRWRLVLGKAAEGHGISIDGGDEQAARIEALVGFLFGEGRPGRPERPGGSPSRATAAAGWGRVTP